jgi:hypothetical protein
MLPVEESTWPAELTPPGQFGARRRHGELRKQALDRYAERMWRGLTPSTKPPAPARLKPLYVPPKMHHVSFAMTRQCFICRSWKWCGHREPELVDLCRANPLDPARGEA